MKKIILLALLPACLALQPFSEKPVGAWEKKEGSITHTLVIVDDYYSLSIFDVNAKRFIHTEGGTCRVDKDMMNGEIEYNTTDKTQVGRGYAFTFSMNGTNMKTFRDGKDDVWVRTDDGKGPLAGNWRITAREQAGKMVEIKPAARKTIKLLSGKRFQWAAINSETGDFFGTGGGSYTFEQGKYTEHIDFFSRDSSRVGMSLSFDGKVLGRNWQHSGKSSKGEPINETWSR
jgi:hypothetical protein